MYIIVDNQSVILGPMTWRPNYFAQVIEEEFNLSVKLSFKPPSDAVIITDPILDENPPYNVLDAGIRILSIRDKGTTTAYNSLLHNKEGPYYNFYADYADMYHSVVDKDINEAKELMKQVVSANRYRYEVMGTPIILQGKDLTAITARGERDLYLQAYQLGSNNINWKFGTEFINISNTELGTVAAAVSNHVQSVFDWESNKVAEIDAATTIAELEIISLVSDNVAWEPVSELSQPPE